MKDDKPISDEHRRDRLDTAKVVREMWIRTRDRAQEHVARLTREIEDLERGT